MGPFANDQKKNTHPVHEVYMSQPTWAWTRLEKVEGGSARAVRGFQPGLECELSGEGAVILVGLERGNGSSCIRRAGLVVDTWDTSYGMGS